MISLSAQESEDKYAVWKPRPVEPPPVAVATIVCPEGYECHLKGTGFWFTVDQLASVDKKLAEQANQIQILQLGKMRHFGLCIGAGGMVGPEMNGGQSGITGTLGVGALWGWRF